MLSICYFTSLISANERIQKLLGIRELYDNLDWTLNKNTFHISCHILPTCQIYVVKRKAGRWWTRLKMCHEAVKFFTWSHKFLLQDARQDVFVNSQGQGHKVINYYIIWNYLTHGICTPNVCTVFCIDQKLQPKSNVCGKTYSQTDSQTFKPYDP